MVEGIKKFVSIFKWNVDKSTHVDYHVKRYTLDGKPLEGMVFRTRQLAREYKKVIKGSFPTVEVKIIERSWDSGYIVSERIIT